ncbi:MAG: hypothetical protein CL840_08190 [Crocinitomicaceae bacterium]|nr:hypothetical protein [Crocinitomicaceae bacterium]
MENLQSNDKTSGVNWNPIAAIFLISFGLYTNTLNFEFVLDDKIVVTNNEFTKRGFDGIADIFTHDSMTGFFGQDKNLVAGGRYRPLSMATHAIEWQLFGDEPLFYHFTNVVLYAISGILLYLVLLNLFPLTSVWYLSIPFIAALLFQVNPLHTEVVANIKSRDEILSIVFALLSFYYLLKYIRNNQTRLLPMAGALFFFGLLSKESAIVFVGIIPLFIYVLNKEITLSRLAVPVGVLLLSGFLYVAMRYAVIGGVKTEIASELMNNPFLDATATEQWATVFYVLFMYLKLLWVPHPLTHDYYPKQIEITGFSDPIVILSLLLHAGLVVLFLYGIKKRNFYGLIAGIYLGGIFLYSNMLFPIGTFMNERFLYVPSIGIALVTAYWIYNFIKSKQLRMTLFTVLIVGYSVKTFSRNYAWESDTTLAITDVEYSSNSAKCNMSAGLAYIDLADVERKDHQKKKYLNLAIKHLNKSLEIYPTYSPPILLLGNAYTNLKNYDKAISYYETCLKSKTQINFALQNLEFVGQEATNENKFELAEKVYLIYLQYKADPKIEEKLGELYGKNMGQLEKSILHLNNAYNALPNDPNIIQKLGVAYAISGRGHEAISLFKKGTKLDEGNANLWLNLGYAYAGVGNDEESKRCLLKAYELDPSLKPTNN